MQKMLAVKVVAVIGFAVIAMSCGGSSGASGQGPETSNSEAVSTSGRSSAVVAKMLVGGALSGAEEATGSTTKSSINKGLVELSRTFDVQLPCAAGNGKLTNTLSGQIVYDDVTSEILSLDVNIDLKEELYDCSDVDDPDTADFDESQISINSEIDAEVQMSYPVDGSISLNARIFGDAKFSGGEVCPNGGTVTVDITCDATADAPDDDSDPDFSGSMGGTIKGNACGEDISCKLSGDCDNPRLVGTGC